MSKHYDEEIYAGKETAWSSVADFFIDPDEKLQVRKLTVRDQGNPGQIMLGRAGPDGSSPTETNDDGTPIFTRPTTPPVGTNIGHIAWQSYEAEAEGFGDRLAQIHCRRRGEGQGSLHFSTSQEERMALTEDGYLDVTGLMNWDDDTIKVCVGGRKGRISIQWEN